MMTTDKKIALYLNEHDAAKILALIRREVSREDKIWQPYWERLAQNVEQNIEHSGYSLFKQASHPGVTKTK